MVSRQLETRDELVLQESAIGEGFIEAERAANCEKEQSKVLQSYECGGIRVEFGPDFSEAVADVIVEEAFVLHLSVLVPVNDDADEELDEYEAHDEHKAHEVEHRTVLAPTAHSLVAVCNVVSIHWVLDAVVPRSSRCGVAGESQVPGVSSGHSEERDEC